MRAIVAADENWGIGWRGDQLAYLKEDLQRFRDLTMGQTVILGRKTLSTFPGGRPLKGRENLVLSTAPGCLVEGARVLHSLDALLACAPADSFVIGGGSVYAALLPFCDTVYVTRIHRRFQADVWFPDLDALDEWQIAAESAPLEQDGLVYHYIIYQRRAGEKERPRHDVCR